MFFHQVEYPITEKVDDVLNWLEKDLQKPIKSFENDKIRVTFESKRSDNIIKVSHSVYDVLAQKHIGGYVSFSFELEKITDTKSIIIGKYAHDNDYIEMLFYLYLSRLGFAFNADFKQSVTARLEKIQAEIEKEQGGRMGFTEWRTVKGTRIKMRCYGIIPSNPAPHVDATQAAEPPKPVSILPSVDIEIEKRREQVLKLKQYGHSDKHIANNLAVSTKTVQRDKQALNILKSRKKGH